jgi:hypothetical protein
MQQTTKKPKWLFKLGRAISTVSCRNSQKEINVANGYKNSRWSTVFYFSLKAKKETCFCFKSCIVPHSSLKFRKTRINYSLVN